MDQNHAWTLIYCVSVLGIIATTSFYYFHFSAYAQNENEVLISVNTSYADKPYEYWTQKWWEWNLSLNDTSHPVEEYSDKKCAAGQTQESPVWFLVQPFPYPEPDQEFQRTCTIPQGKAIITATQSGYCNEQDKYEPHTDDELRKCATMGNEGTIVSYVTIDNETYANYHEGRRVQTDFFNTSIKNDSKIGTAFEYEKEGNFKSLADGYYIFLKPLKPGVHILKYHYETTPPKGSSFEFGTYQTGTWNLIIK